MEVSLVTLQSLTTDYVSQAAPVKADVEKAIPAAAAYATALNAISGFESLFRTDPSLAVEAVLEFLGNKDKEEILEAFELESEESEDYIYAPEKSDNESGNERRPSFGMESPLKTKAKKKARLCLLFSLIFS
jgi:hypothetical protein